MSGGFFKVDRSIFDHEIWSNPVDFRLFLLIVGKAIFAKDGVEKAGLHISRGQWLRSYRMLQKDLEYKEGRGLKQYGLATIKRSINRLIKNGMITVSETEHGTLFTVVNYEKYQGSRDAEETDAEHLEERQRNDSGTMAERERNNNKNVVRMTKNEKNDIDNTPKSNKRKQENLSSTEDVQAFVESLMASNPLPVSKKLLVKYIDCLRLTRKTCRISTNIIDNLWQKWKQYDPDVVSFAMWEHTDRHDDKREEYTLGIMRRTDVHEARRKLIIKKNKEGGYNNAINGERGTQDSKDTSGKESSFITSSYYDQFEGLFGEGG